MIKLFKVVATSSRPLEVQGMAKYQVTLLSELRLPLSLIKISGGVPITLYPKFKILFISC